MCDLIVKPDDMQVITYLMSWLRVDVHITLSTCSQNYTLLCMLFTTGTKQKQITVLPVAMLGRSGPGVAELLWSAAINGGLLV